MLTERETQTTLEVVMREGRLIIPENEWKLVMELRTALISKFGGYTEIAATGGWKDPNGLTHLDPSIAFDVAYEQNTLNDETFFHLAQWAATAFKQEAIYLRYPNGFVQFVDKHSNMENGRPIDAYAELYDGQFTGILDAANTLIDPAQTSGTRIAAFDYLNRASDRHRDTGKKALIHAAE